MSSAVEKGPQGTGSTANDSSQKDSKSGKVFDLAEAQLHTTEQDCWIIIDGKVFDVTKFLDEHPGGYDIILTNTGKDATESFEEIGHSNAAKELLAKYYIGEYKGGPPLAAKPAKKTAAAAPSAVDRIPLLKVLQVLLPVIVAALAYVLFFSGDSKK